MGWQLRSFSYQLSVISYQLSVSVIVNVIVHLPISINGATAGRED